MGHLRVQEMDGANRRRGDNVCWLDRVRDCYTKTKSSSIITLSLNPVGMNSDLPDRQPQGEIETQEDRYQTYGKPPEGNETKEGENLKRDRNMRK